jgi:hypothetical protein
MGLLPKDVMLLVSNAGFAAGVIMIRCDECNQNLVEEFKEGRWFRLMHLVEFLKLQGDISDELYNTAVSDLMYFKEFALRERWQMEEQAEMYKEQQKENQKPG